MYLAKRLSLYFQLTRLNRPIGILLLLWPTLWAVWIAGNGHPAWHVVEIFVLGTVLMRSAGCAINDYADRDLDRHVKRTRERPLTSGKLAPVEALWVAATLALLSLLLILPLNTFTILLSVPAVFLAASYPFTKRFLAIPQAYLGIAFGFGIPMAFAAQLNAVPWHGGCCWRTSSGVSPTTPNMRWWTATTISISVSILLRCSSADTTWWQ